MTKQTLTQTLTTLRAGASDRQRELYDGLVQLLVDSGAVANALKEGDVFPDFMLASADGHFVRRDEVLAKGIAVFSFYRGEWCPYCSAELSALADAAPQIAKAGGQLVAVTPEAGGRALRTKLERQLQFEVLCDLDNSLAFECGLVFPVPDSVRSAYLARGINFSTVYGNEAWLLPTPATYIVGRNGVILRAHVDPDFRRRLDPEEILAVLGN